jgi:hypothetical protein
MERALGAFERALWIQDRINCSNSAVVARLDGPLSDAVLRRALRKLQKRHPLLGVHIAGGDRDPRFESAGTPKITVRTLDQVRRGQKEAGWQAQTEYELNTPMNVDEGPLIRVVSLRPAEIGSGDAETSDTTSDLIVTTHGTIGDAASGVQLLQDLLQLMAGSGADSTLPERRSVDVLLPKNTKKAPKGLGGWLKKAHKLEADMSVAADERVTRIIGKQLKPAEVEALIERCRREQTTVHGALWAAFATELDRDITGRGTKKPTIPCGTVVNLRGHIDAGGEELGVLSSTVCAYHKVAGSSFWDVARDVKKQVSDAMDRGDHLAAVRQLAGFAPSGIDGAVGFADHMFKRDASNTVMHNLGALPVANELGPFTIRKVQFAKALPFYENLRVAVATHRGWLTWNLMYVEGEVADDRAQRIAENCIASLREAAKV